MFLPQLIFIICISKIGAVPLLMSWTSSVRLLDEHNTTHIRAIIPSTVAVVAVDYHFKRNEIYFSDGTGRIKRARLYPDISTSQDPITIAEVRQSDGLAVDWINDNLYWTDVTRMTVEMSTLDGLYRRVLFNSTHGVEMPRGIALDPFQGIMFWTDWGSSERVESAGLDGKSKSTIVTSGMFWPNAVTLDLNRQIVYILEGKLAKIISCNYDGTNQNVVFSSDGYLEQAFGLSFFANRLYWDSWKETAVFSIDLNPVGSVRSVYRRTSLGILQRLTERMMGIKAVDPSLQRGLTVRNPCQSKGCSHKCVNSRGFTASCICPFGFQLQADEKTCLEEGYLLMSWRRTIRRYNLQGKEEESMFDYSKAAISISYHYKKKLVFWSDIEEHRIYRAPLEQLNNKTVVVSTETCDGLAVDWVHDVLYWTDTEQNTLEASQLDGSKRKIIFSDDLDKPRDIAIDPESGYMFWTDWGAKPRIERAVLDGSERRMIVDQQILWPNGITIDFEYHRIYWVDGKMATISSSLYDGSDRRTILEHLTNTPTPFGISLIKDKIYWTDWSFSGLMAGKKSEGIDSYHLLANSSTIILRPYGVKVVHSSLQKEKENPCAALVCSEICLGTKSPQKPHCVGGVLESKGLIKTVKNDSIHLSLSASPPIVMAIIRVKCVGRNGCSNDTRCSSQASEVTLPFLNQTSFNISGLLPASHYDLHFQSPTMSETFQLVTAETDPPELPKITSVKAEERSVTIKWDPVDSCVPGFDSYHYRLLRTHQDPDSTLTSREGNTTDTQVFLDNLQGEVNYTFHLYTLDAAHYSKVTFKTEPADELPVCRTGIFLCNGVNDCADASDESLETCTAIDSITVYKKNDSSVSFRVRVAEGTKRHLHKFVVSGTMSNTPAVSKEFLAVPCVIWSDSYCFSVTSLEYDKVYDFLIQVVLKDGKTGKSYEATARTKEGESGRPEDLTVISLTSTSVELQWSHPNQSNGDIRSFLVYISETDSFLPGQCCQDFPVLNSPVTSEEATYRVEPGSLSPATTYSITISVRTNLVGGSALLQVHTPPPHMKIVKHLRIALPSGKTLTWQPQNVLEEDQPQYHSLVKYYLLLALVDGEEEPQNWRVKTGLGAVQSMVESEIGSRYHLIQRYDEGRVPSEQTLSYYVFPRRYEYRLVWVQVSQYKTVFSVDYIISDKFKTDIVH